MNKLIALIVVVVLALFVLIKSVYVVNERQLAVVTEFSKVVSTQDDTGLKFKLPFVQHVEYFDKRIQRLDVAPESFLTNEKKNVIVDYYVEWKIADVEQFYLVVKGNNNRAGKLLDNLVKDGLRTEFVQRSILEVISEDRGALMDNLTDDLNKEAARYGIEIVGMRLKRVDFPDDLREDVFKRMRAERERVSKSLRAQGKEQAQVIRATADRKAAELIAKSSAQAEIRKGDAEAQAAKTYAEAYNHNIAFYEFWRTMNAYKSGFSKGDDVLILDDKTPIMEYILKNGSGYSPRMNGKAE